MRGWPSAMPPSCSTPSRIATLTGISAPLTSTSAVWTGYFSFFRGTELGTFFLGGPGSLLQLLYSAIVACSHKILFYKSRWWADSGLWTASCTYLLTSESFQQPSSLLKCKKANTEKPRDLPKATSVQSNDGH